jgi:hypothetical protein
VTVLGILTATPCMPVILLFPDGIHQDCEAHLFGHLPRPGPALAGPQAQDRAVCSSLLILAPGNRSQAGASRLAHSFRTPRAGNQRLSRHGQLILGPECRMTWTLVCIPRQAFRATLRQLRNAGKEAEDDEGFRNRGGIRLRIRGPTTSSLLFSQIRIPVGPARKRRDLFRRLKPTMIMITADARSEPAARHTGITSHMTKTP